MKLFLLLIITLFLVISAGAAQQYDAEGRILIGVSGTLMEGLDLRERLDWKARRHNNKKPVKASYIGQALVRGYKGYFNIQERDANAVVLPTGCHDDGHIFAFYLVAPEQLPLIVYGSPHDWTISSNGGTIDLTALETSQEVKELAQREIQRHGFSNEGSFSALLVTGMWFDAQHYVEMPVISTSHDDGTHVTSFVDSLALWSGANGQDLVANTFSQIRERNAAWKTVFEKVTQVKSTYQSNNETSYPKVCGHLYLNYLIRHNEESSSGLRSDQSCQEVRSSFSSFKVNRG